MWLDREELNSAPRKGMEGMDRYREVAGGGDDSALKTGRVRNGAVEFESVYRVRRMLGNEGNFMCVYMPLDKVPGVCDAEDAGGASR